MASISVVIPAYNDAVMLERCLLALAAQSRQADEIIVVDNGSTDATAAVARAAGATVVAEPNRGIMAATAAGFDAASGDLLARLDADSLPPAGWLSRIEETFAANPSLTAMTGPGDFYGANRFVHWAGRVLFIGGYFLSMRLMMGHAPLFGSNFALRSEAWRQLRLTSHRTLYELHDDLDLSFQLTPDMTVLLDRGLRVGVSSRPFSSRAGLARRLRWAYETFSLNLGEQSFRSRRAARRAWAREHRRDAGS